MFDLGQLFGFKKTANLDVDNFVLEDFNDKNVRISLKNGVALKEKLSDKAYLLDVRTKDQYDYAHVKGADHFDVEDMMGQIPDSYDKDNLFIVYCNTGGSSNAAQMILSQKGYKVIDAGGIVGYDGEIEGDYR